MWAAFSVRCPVPLIEDMFIESTTKDIYIYIFFLNYYSIAWYHVIRGVTVDHLGITGSCIVRSVFCASLEAVVPRGLIKHTDFVYRCLSCGRLEDYYVLEKDNFYQCLTLSCCDCCNVQTLDQSEKTLLLCCKKRARRRKERLMFCGHKW